MTEPVQQGYTMAEVLGFLFEVAVNATTDAVVELATWVVRRVGDL